MFNFLNYLKKLNFNVLPNMNGQHFVYRKEYQLQKQFDLDIAEEKKIDDIYIYGWIIEVFHVDKRDWTEHWNHKLYLSKDSAIDAINQSRPTRECRVVPVYSFKNNGWRNHIINKIIKEDKL